MKNILWPKIPIPKKIPINFIFTVLKKIKDLFDEKSKELSNLDSISDNASVEDIDSLMKVLSEFKEYINQNSLEIEKLAEEEIEYYIEEIKIILNENSEKVEKYNIKVYRTEKEISKIKARLKGIIGNEVSKEISLSDSRCKNLIKMIPGKRKEEEIKNYFKSIVKNALNSYCKELRLNIDEIYDELEYEILDNIKSVQNNYNNLKNKVDFISSEENNNNKQLNLIEANYIIKVCNNIEFLLGEEE